MTLSTIAKAITTAAGDFAGHTSSTPPRSYFGGAIHVPGIDEDPWEGTPEHEMERVRFRLAADAQRRQDAAVRRVQAGADARRVLKLA